MRPQLNSGTLGRPQAVAFLMSPRLIYPEPEPALVARLVPLAERLNELAEVAADCSLELAEFNAIAGTTIDQPFEFHFAGTCTAQAFVRDQLARKHVQEFRALQDDDLLELLGTIQTGARPHEAPFWLEVLELNLPQAPVSDLIFYPADALASLGIDGDTELEPDAILRIARAASRPPILL
ncbi:MAG TPA: hypothetical protein VHP33_26960 [Polyangiaceae bacterium]|nr:hypothetical protein [Polyangiaceae bacterium]